MLSLLLLEGEWFLQNISEPASQHVWKAVFTCVVYIDEQYSTRFSLNTYHARILSAEQ